MSNYQTHLFTDHDQLCGLLLQSELCQHPARALVGTTKNSLISPALRRRLFNKFHSTLLQLPRSVWVTGGSDNGIFSILSDAMISVNKHRVLGNQHIMIGFAPEGKDYRAIAPAVSHMFLLKDAEMSGAESPYIAKAAAYIGQDVPGQDDGIDRMAYAAGGGEVTRHDIAMLGVEGIRTILLKGSGRAVDAMIDAGAAVGPLLDVEEI